MSSLESRTGARNDSPDPASHAANIYDEIPSGNNESDNDDIDYEPAETETSDDFNEDEFFELMEQNEMNGDEEEEEEEEESSFHGNTIAKVQNAVLTRVCRCQ